MLRMFTAVLNRPGFSGLAVRAGRENTIRSFDTIVGPGEADATVRIFDDSKAEKITSSTKVDHGRAAGVR